MFKINQRRFSSISWRRQSKISWPKQSKTEKYFVPKRRETEIKNCRKNESRTPGELAAQDNSTALIFTKKRRRSYKNYRENNIWQNIHLSSYRTNLCYFFREIFKNKAWSLYAPVFFQPDFVLAVLLLLSLDHQSAAAEKFSPGVKVSKPSSQSQSRHLKQMKGESHGKIRKNMLSTWLLPSFVSVSISFPLFLRERKKPIHSDYHLVKHRQQETFKILFFLSNPDRTFRSFWTSSLLIGVFE